MDEETRHAFLKVAVLQAQLDARLSTIQALIERSVNGEQQEALRRDWEEYYETFLSKRIESAEDIDPLLAIELQSVLDKSRKAKDQNDE
jgi:hypothetical protein